MEVYNEDCVQVMNRFIIDNRHFNYCITSPPYNMQLRVRYGKYFSRSPNEGGFSKKYSGYEDNMPLEIYYDFLDSVISKLLRLCNITFFNIQMITGNKPSLLKILGRYSDWIKDIIIWNKINAQPAMHEGTLNSQYEFIIIFDANKPYNRSFDNANFQRGTESNVWDILTQQNNYNKASFPEELVSRILRDFTKENDMIFDPFMGSGTTGIVCSKMNRLFVGCEIDNDMFEIAKERIHNQESQQKLF